MVAEGFTFVLMRSVLPFENDMLIVPERDDVTGITGDIGRLWRASCPLVSTNLFLPYSLSSALSFRPLFLLSPSKPSQMAISSSSPPRHKKPPRTKWRSTKVMKVHDLARDDDFLSHLLVEKLGTGDIPLLVHKMDPSRRLPKTNPQDLMAIIRHVRRSLLSLPLASLPLPIALINALFPLQ